ncbi:MAG TPA: protein translocase subunit SecF [Bacillota bacterium]|nr:protein translocase subunit SecF [Bacillota bacterium]
MNIMGLRKIWYTISLVLIIPGIIAMVMNTVNTGAPLNLGLDFTGGTLLTVQFEKQPHIDQIRAVTDEMKLGTATIQEAGGKEVLIKVRALSETERNNLVKSLNDKFGSMKVVSESKVGPIIGQELTRNAIFALLIAFALIIAYISFRFEFRFAIAAIVALFHDVLAILGVFAIFKFEVDSSFVAAVLTIVGYSINDTIVIFDRIRENLTKPVKGESIETLVNRSIMQVIVRSINTVLTVIFVLVALLVFGGETLRYFVLALLIGVISGAYSSIFNASPLWVDFKTLSTKLAKAR